MPCARSPYLEPPLPFLPPWNLAGKPWEPEIRGFHPRGQGQGHSLLRHFIHFLSFIQTWKLASLGSKLDTKAYHVCVQPSEKVSSLCLYVGLLVATPASRQGF